jgi:acyl-CoA thioester hydrolase
MISSIGLNNTKLLNEHGVLVIVKSCNIDYKKPARLEDVLKISSKIISSTRTSFAMKQIISKQSDIISEAEVKLVCIDSKGKPVQIPNAINDLIKS